MIQFKPGDIFRLKVDALVNPVNCLGTMGKGLALEFKKRYPVMFDAYMGLVDQNRMKLGKVNLVKSGVEAPKTIVLFPTKYDWRENSLYMPIVNGLHDMIDKCRIDGITSVGVPALGCGLGGQQWDTMEKVLKRELIAVPDIKFIVVPPIDT